MEQLLPSAHRTWLLQLSYRLDTNMEEEKQLVPTGETMFLPLAKLTATTKEWISKVMLLETSLQRCAKKSRRPYKRYTFVDAQETKIRACAFDEDINMMDGFLHLFKTYQLSADTSKTLGNEPPKFNENCQLILNQRSSICPLDRDEFEVTLGKPNYVEISKIHTYLESEELFNMIAIVIDVGYPKQRGEYRLQEIMLITEEKIPTKLTLWNDVVDAEGAALLKSSKERRIVSFSNLKVKATSFEGNSLSAISMTNITFEPPYPETQNLQHWKQQNEEYLDDLIQAKAYWQAAYRIQDEARLTKVAEILHSAPAGDYKCQGTIQILISHNQKLTYNGCDKCSTKTITPVGLKYICFKCETVHVSEKRAMLQLNIHDTTTTLKCVAYENVASTILNANVFELDRQGSENVGFFCIDRNKVLLGKTFVAWIKKKQPPAGTLQSFSYTLTRIEEPAEEILPAGNPKSPANTLADAKSEGPSGLTPIMANMQPSTKDNMQPRGKSAAVKNLNPLMDEVAEGTHDANVKIERAERAVRAKKYKMADKKNT